MGAGFLLVGVGIYAVFLFANRQRAITGGAKPTPTVPTGKLPAVIGAPNKPKSVAERFNDIKNNVREQFRYYGWKPPGGEIPDIVIQR